jgi:dipeptidyl aminopeptidase/acylaminoacyl peptidase
VIYNRGGNREFGALNENKMAHIIARIASWGYIVAASNYRGNGGGEGLEQFGGEDVNDIINLLPLFEHLENADAARIGMFGWSRGGMMTYLALKRNDSIKAAVVGGGLSDLFLMKSDRPEMEEVYIELIPSYKEDTEGTLAARSAIRWPEKVCKTTPILMLHGTADWRVIPRMALELAEAFIKVKQPFRLVLLEGGDHGLSEHDDEVFRLAETWLNKYVRDGTPLPNLEPHGK